MAHETGLPASGWAKNHDMSRPCAKGIAMSWVTDILLIFNVKELYDADHKELAEVPALRGIQSWFEEKGRLMLDNLDQHAISGGKVMQACVYGGAYNFLEIKEFIEVVKSQPWQEPENVQLLIQDEEEPRFTLHTLT